MTRLLKKYWPVVPTLAVYSLLANALRFTQDDAFITFRYVANYLNGDGMVFNIGERVEGITNFGWAVILMFLGVLGLDYVTLAQTLGYLFGAATIVVVWLLARKVLDQEGFWYAVVALLLLGANQSFAYWSQAGLETAAFAFFAVLSLLFYVKRSWLLVFSLTMMVWLRPEGALVTGILIIIEIIETRRVPKFTFISAALAFVFSLPMVGFKLAYYGDILPNPFYAKTSFSTHQWADGVEYVGRYMSHYGFFGAIYLVPLLFYRRLSITARAVWWFSVLYTAYILFIGGDVLKVHRFFLPVFGPAAILAGVSIQLLLGFVKPVKLRPVLLFVTALALLFVTYDRPHKFVSDYHDRELSFVYRMKWMAEQMRQDDTTNFTVALPTIGVFGYELIGHDIIDMVGLTDSTIARHEEEPIPGMEAAWKERKHNSRYLLERAPDYIMFSTGIKPSAPAEKALLLYRPFIDSYRSVGWYFTREDGRAGALSNVFKRVRPIEGELVPTYPLEYVDEFKIGLETYLSGDQEGAIAHYLKAKAISPKPEYPYIDYQIGLSLLLLKRYTEAEQVLDHVCAQDSMVYEAHKDLYRMARLQGKEAKAAIHARWLQKLVPWYWPRVYGQSEADLRRGSSRK